MTWVDKFREIVSKYKFIVSYEMPRYNFVKFVWNDDFQLSGLQQIRTELKKIGITLSSISDARRCSEFILYINDDAAQETTSINIKEGQKTLNELGKKRNQATTAFEEYYRQLRDKWERKFAEEVLPADGAYTTLQEKANAAIDEYRDAYNAYYNTKHDLFTPQEVALRD